MTVALFRSVHHGIGVRVDHSVDAFQDLLVEAPIVLSLSVEDFGSHEEVLTACRDSVEASGLDFEEVIEPLGHFTASTAAQHLCLELYDGGPFAEPPGAAPIRAALETIAAACTGPVSMPYSTVTLHLISAHLSHP
jgi:hypothetical protein